LKGHIGSVNTAIFDATGDYVISGGQDKRIHLSNAGTGRLVQSYNGHGWAVQGVAISKNSSQMASCGGDRMVFVWDINTAQISRKLSGHKQRVDCVAVNSDGSIVASGSFDKSVCIWDLRAAPRTPLQVLDESRDGISSMVITASELISGSIDGSVRTYDMRMGRMLEDALGSPVVSVSVANAQSQILCVGCMDSTVQLLDQKNGGKVVATFSGHKCTEYRVQCDANEITVASGSEDGFVYLWNTKTTEEIEQPRTRLAGHSGIVNSVMLHPRSCTDPVKQTSMVTAGSDGAVVIW
ncbi:WD40 repeat-like protein, partial [Coemansia reversa NRRL 1564]